MFSGKITHLITFKCNLNCIMCSCGNDPISDREELSTDEVLSYLETLPRSSELGLSGGELFLRNDIDQLVIAASKKTSKIVLLTNCTHINELEGLIKKLKNADTLEELSVITSIDGAKPETHDTIRGLKGAQSRTIESMKLLQDFNIRCGATMAIQPKNYREIWAVYQLCKQMRIKFLCQMVEPRVNFTLLQVKEIYKQLKLVWEDIKKPNNDLYYENRLNYEYYLKGLLYHYIYKKRSLPCYVSKNIVPIIDAFGDVYPCPDAPFLNNHDYGNPELVMGNVKDDPFMEIINSDKAKEALKRLDSENCNRCWSGCSYAPSLQYIQTLPEEDVLKIDRLHNSH